MKRVNKILVPTDLSEHSRRALTYGCRLAAEDKASLVVLHVANELNAWELSTEFQLYTGDKGRLWPLDRVLSEASLDLNNFLEPHLNDFKQLACATKRVVLGNVLDRITSIAEQENTDLSSHKFPPLSPQNNSEPVTVSVDRFVVQLFSRLS